MKIPFQLLLLLLVLATGAGGVALLRFFKPEPEQQTREDPLPAVEVLTVSLERLPVTIRSQGFIEPLTETQLAAEVAGRVVAVADQLRTGGRFRQGDVLLRIDPSDYLAALAEAEARLADARLNLSQEQARSAQALRDWEKLGTGEAPSDLVARRLHLASAEAAVRAAEAALEKARRDHERTEIKAPYDGRVRAVHLDLGSFASIGSPIAEIHSASPFEIRLPIPLDDIPYLDLETAGEAELTATVGGIDHLWQAPIMRTEGEIDRSSRSIFLVARVTPQPRSEADALELLQPGLFVQASIPGRVLERSVALPQRAFSGPDTVIVVSPDNTIDLRPVTVSRSRGELRIVTDGLADGDRVVLTPLALTVQDMPVRVLEPDEPPPPSDLSDLSDLSDPSHRSDPSESAVAP